MNKQEGYYDEDIMFACFMLGALWVWAAGNGYRAADPAGSYGAG
jgi:hypothetical protein